MLKMHECNINNMGAYEVFHATVLDTIEPWFDNCKREDFVCFNVNKIFGIPFTELKLDSKVLCSSTIHPALCYITSLVTSERPYEEGLYLLRVDDIKFVYARGSWPGDVISLQYVYTPRMYLNRLVEYFKKCALHQIECKEPVLPDALFNETMESVFGFLENADTARKYEANMKHGIVFHGSPGNGKTMLCQYIKDVCTVKGYSYSSYSNESIKQRANNNTLESVLCNDNDVIFLDDIDMSLFDRKGGLGTTLLGALDGINKNKRAVVRIFTTNEVISHLDPAFRRPGRIDKVLEFQKPTAELRRKLINDRWHTDILSRVDIEDVVSKTTDFSFAELQYLYTTLVHNQINNKDEDYDLIIQHISRHRGGQQKKIGFCIFPE